MKCYKIILILMVFLFGLRSQVFAAQIVEIYPDIERRIIVSKLDINKLHFSNDNIISIYSNQGEFTYKKSDVSGDLYFRIQSSYKENIPLFIETEKGFTYKLLLSAKNIPSEQIVLLNPEITEKGKNSKKDTYKQEISKIIKQIAIGAVPNGFEIKREAKSLNYKISNLKIKEKEIIGPTHSNPKLKLQIYTYVVTNDADVEIKPNESDFFKDGVLAVSFDQSILKPNEKANLVIIKGSL